jgi:alpha-ketoglutarate-dependent taurine dioxygenase
MTLTELRGDQSERSGSVPTSITVAPVAGLIGAQIGGVDLGCELSEAQVADIRTALLRWKVIFFRDQHVGPDEQVAFGRRFGEVTPAHPTLPALEGHPEILQLSTEDYRGATGDDDEDKTNSATPLALIENRWHTDVTFVANPPMGSILRAVDVPPYGGDTGWTNLVTAYESLSAPIRSLLDSLRAVHHNELHVELGGARGSALRKQFASTAFSSVHPVVRVHPETGERALFVNPGFTSHIVGLRNRESRRILDLCYEATADPRHTVRFRWAPGSIAFWDNRATSHLASFDYIGPHPRTLQRITLAGDVPVGPDGFESESVAGGSFS